MKTRINISTQTYRKISFAASRLGVSHSRVIKLLMLEFEKNLKSHIHTFRTVKYQRKGENDEWIMFHICLTPAEYEHFTDLRNASKMSVSLILAKAVENYLHNLVGMDNYPLIPFPVYVVSFDFNTFGLKTMLATTLTTNRDTIP